MGCSVLLRYTHVGTNLVHICSQGSLDHDLKQLFGLPELLSATYRLNAIRDSVNVLLSISFVEGLYGFQFVKANCS